MSEKRDPRGTRFLWDVLIAPKVWVLHQRRLTFVTERPVRTSDPRLRLRYFDGRVVWLGLN